MDIKSISTFIKGRMNKSVDERVLPPGEYVDALNVRVGATETTEIGALENSKGNQLLTGLQFRNVALSANARCIGAIADGQEENIYWFVHDPTHPQAPNPPNKVDLIVSYNTTTEITRYHVESTSVLNFDPSYLITGVDLIDDLLFFTDDFNPPRKINVNFDYPDVDANGVDQIIEEDLSVIVKPPGFQDAALVAVPDSETLTSPNVQLILISNQENYLENKFVSFAYRYRYLNSEYSATSLFTLPAFQPGRFKFSYENYNNESMQNRFNGAEVTFNTGSERVIEVDVLYKFSNSTTIFKIDSYNKQQLGWGDNQDRTIEFSNSKIYTVLSSDEILRLYDNVPRLAKAQTIMANRLIYGNYIDGYNISALSADGAKITPNYTVQQLSEEIGLFSIPYPTLLSTTYTINPSAAYQALQSTAVFDLDSIKTQLKKGSQLIIALELTSVHTAARSINNSTLAIEPCTATNLPTPECQGWSSTVTSGVVNINCFVDLSQDYAGSSAVYDFLLSDDFQNAIGTIEGVNFQPMATASAGYSLTDSFNTNVLTQGGFTKVISSISSSTNMQGFGLFVTGPNATTFTLTSLAMESQNNTGSFTISSYEYFTITNASVIFVSDADQGSLHSNRDYEVGLVYMDEYARASTVLVSQNNTKFIPPANSILKNKLQVTLESNPPYWAKRWKYVVKASAENYETIYTNTFVQATDGTVWCKLQGDNADKVKSGDLLIVKRDADGPLLDVVKVEVLQAQAQPKDFAGTGAIPATQQPGFYMNLNALEFTVDLSAIPNTWNYSEADNNGSTNRCNSQDKVPLYYDENYVQGGSTGVLTNINLPAGSTIVIKYHAWRNEGTSSCERIDYYYEQSFTTSQDFDDLYTWWTAANPDLDSGVNQGNITSGAPIRVRYVATMGNTANIVSLSSGSCATIVPPCEDPQLNCPPQGAWWSNFQFARDNPNDPTSPLVLAWRAGIPQCGWGGPKGRSRLTIEIVQGGSLLAFETEPTIANAELFYDSPKSYPIIGGYHSVGSVVASSKNTIPITVNQLNDSTGQFTASVSVGDFVYNTTASPVTTATVITVNSPTSLTLDADIFTVIDQDYSIVHNQSGDQNQTPTQASIINLPFINCYSFGNGIESFKILDRLEGMAMNLGERVLAVSNQEFKEANRFAGLTYSGIFSGPANFNNLNEFNLGLVNFKDLETFFGEIQVLHARKTDILVLQEDRISYVLAGKNILTDAVGGGTVTSVPEVLGEQVARVEEYGNSFNPESFAAWGAEMYFTDTKRGAVLKLTGSSMQNDQLSVISEDGMRSWFRDEFYLALNTQKLGGYDPYMDEYILATNDIQIPFPTPNVPCGTLVQDTTCISNVSWNVDVGNVVGNIVITVTIVSVGLGCQFNAVYNGVTYTTTPNPITTPGTYTVTIPKPTATPNLVSCNIIPNGACNFSVLVACPEELDITVVKVVLNAPDDFGKTIHAEYFWDNGTSISPPSSDPVVMNNDPTVASAWIAQTGTRSIGVFPYDGVNLSIQTNKIGSDSFDFNLTQDKIYWLSSSTLYANTAASIASLLSQSLNQVSVSNPSGNIFRGVQASASIPLANEYLYLIYDLRTVASQFLCYDATSSQAACCDCTVPCISFTASLPGSSPSQVCNQLLGQTYYFTGQGLIPAVGDLVFSDSVCSGVTTILPAGYYKFNTNQVLEVNGNGVVIQINNC